MTIPAEHIHLPMRKEDWDPSNLSAETVNDWDMAAGTTASWTPGNSATLTKQSNGAGGQCLRIARNGVNYPYASQTSLTIGWRTVHARARGDGSAYPILYFNGVEFWRGTTSTSWQDVPKIEYSMSGTGFFIGSNAGGGTQYVEWDFVTVKNADPCTLDISGNDHHAYIGASPAQQSYWPEQLTDKGFFKSSSTQYLNITDPLASASTWAMSMLISDNSEISTTTYPCVVQDATNTYGGFIWVAGSEQWRFYSGASNYAFYNMPSLNIGPIHLYGHYNGSSTDLYVNGQLVNSNGSGGGPSYNNQDVRIFERYTGLGHFYANIHDFRIWLDDYLTDDEIDELYREDIKTLAELTF